jgi:hypothetical protein
MKVLRIAIALAGIIFANLGANAQIILYDNLAPADWSTYYPSGSTVPGNGSLTDEVGDEIVLESGTPRTISDIAIQYYTQNLTGTEQMEVKIYLNDGQVNGDGFKSPGTVLYDSGQFTVPQLNGKGLLNLNSLNIAVPADSFTWSVQFSGISGNKVAGLAINATPSVGSSFSDFWEKPGGTWDLYEFTNPSTPTANFGAQFSAVPEPAESAAVLLGTALAVAVGIRRLRRTSAIP